MLEILLISAGAVLETLFIMQSYRRRELACVGLKTAQTPQEQFMQKSVAPEVAVSITRDMPVDEIYGKLTRDVAVKVVVSAGCYKGKTLGRIAMEKPGSLQWYVDSYKGPDNLLRAAAKYLMDQALAPAC